MTICRAGVLYSARTNGAEPVDVCLFSLPENVSCTFKATILARDVEDGTTNSYVVVACAKRVAGSAVLGSASPAHLFVDEAVIDWAATWVVSGTGVILRVTGEEGRTINWASTVTQQRVDDN